MREFRNFLLFLLGTLVACGGQSRVEGEGFGDVPPITEDNLAEVTAASFCEPLEGCCGAWGVRFDRVRCEDFLSTAFTPAIELVRDGRATLDETAARRCIAELSVALDTCSLEASASCRRALSGTAPEDSPCLRDEECEKPADGSALCDGTCSFRPRSRFGESCSLTCLEELELRNGFWPAYSSSSCQAGAVGSGGSCFRNDGLYCARSSARCERLLPEGSECGAGQCEMHLHCFEGTCRPRTPEGGSCQSNMSSSVEPACDEGLVCTDDRCAPRADPAPSFEPAASICGSG